MNDPVEFLKARLDEDERIAKQGAAGIPKEDWNAETDYELMERQRQDYDQSWHTSRCGFRVHEFVEVCECGVPDRVLLEVAAKRAILEHYDSVCEAEDGCNRRHAALMRQDHRTTEQTDQMVSLRTHGWELAGHKRGTLRSIRLLAQVYADHPEYDPAWKP